MVKDYSDSEKETRCNSMGYSFRLATRVLLYASSHRQDSTYFVTPVVQHRLEREIAQWDHHEGLIRQPIRTTSDRFYHGFNSGTWVEILITFFGGSVIKVIPLIPTSDLQLVHQTVWYIWSFLTEILIKVPDIRYNIVRYKTKIINFELYSNSIVDLNIPSIIPLVFCVCVCCLFVCLFCVFVCLFVC